MRSFETRVGALALLALLPAFTLGALVTFAPAWSLTATLYPPLLVACGPCLPVAVMLALIGLGTPDRKRAALALALFLPAIGCTMYGAHRAHMEGEARGHPSPAAAPPPPARP